ncbi:hypothetical protein B0H15DRAFT_631934 [Mycena belliarum]|uniref:Uncharacterized protein n=1 Tax=Mycena belliarum TaxID=1033014 RepID=A0AAD6UBB0_9AGAR|nr:hypothetical protein B0H15DRAFT_631934 [Mycena belliae]
MCFELVCSWFVTARVDFQNALALRVDALQVSMSDSNTPQAASSDHDPDESRVYFGPFKSPEKKYISAGLAASTQPMDSPSRRSPRLSSPMPVPNPSAEPADEDEGDNAFEEDEDDLSLSRSGTPDNDRWQQDEPSSVLASRITRAHDNPSPPPGPPVLDLESGPRTPDRYPLHPIPFITPHSPSPSSRDGSPSPRPPPSPQNTTQPDLISFDSFSTSVNPLPTQPVASTSSIYPPPHAPSVDELLSTWSPSARDTPAVTISPPPNEKGGEYPKGKARMRESSTPEAAEEQAVANALIYSDVFELPASPQSFQGVTNSVEPYASDDEAPRTPVRRSTRPRRSGTPHAHLVPIPSSDEEDSPARTLLEPSKAFTKKKRKNGKEREISAGTMSIDSGEGSAVSDVPLLEEDREVKKRRERGERKQALGGTPQALLQRQLGSLSPGSANVLTQLLTTSRPSPVREQEEPQQPPYPFSVFPAAHTTPARATSPMRASPARKATPRSPNRIQFQTPHLNDPNRTPARRIPVEQAVARGQISPQKGAQLLTNNLDAGPVSRTPVFHIPSQDTPARRVVAPPSEVQSKWQGTRSGSPTRGKLKERTGSAEPRTPWNATVNTGSSSDIGASASKSRPSPSRTISAPIKKGKLPFPLAPPASDRPAPIPEDKPLLLTAHLPENTATPASSTLLGIIKIPRSTLRQPTSRIPRIGTKPYARPAVQPASDKGGYPHLGRSRFQEQRVGAILMT